MSKSIIFEISEENIKQLNLAINNGYAPCINKLANGLWHVGLNHETFSPTFVRTESDDGTHFKPSPDRLSIHETGAHLPTVIDGAIIRLALSVLDS